MIKTGKELNSQTKINKTLKDLLPRVGSDNDVSYKDDINIMNLNTSGWGSNEDADEELLEEYLH